MAQARAAEAVAQRRAEQFGNVVDAYLEELRGALGKAEGSTVARKVLAATALRASEQLQKEGGDDPQVRRKLANVYMILGNVQGGVRGGSEGSRLDTMASFEKALSIRRDLSATYPGDAALMRDCAAASLNLADVLVIDHQTDAGLKHYKDAIDTARKALAMKPEDRETLRTLSPALVNLGDQLIRAGKLEESKGLLEESLAIRRKLADRSPADPESRRDLSVGLNRMGSWYEAAGRLEDAVGQYQASADIRRQLLAAEANARTKRDLAIAQEKLGGDLAKLKRFDQAQEELDAAMTTMRSLSEADPADARAVADAGRIDQALSALQAAHGKR